MDQAQAAKDILAQSAYPELRAIKVTTSGETLVLNGSVKSFHLKQLAQQALLCNLQNVQVHNKVKVAEITDIDG